LGAALLVARLVLGAVFALAGVAKLSDLEGSRRAIIDFGVPSAIAAPLGLVLPLAELAVAATLLPASTAWWGALGALALLSVFVVGITYNLARGRKPECHCFGQLHSAPAGWKTLARNGVLVAVAGFVLWAGYEGGAGPSALSWVGALSTAQLVGFLGGVLVLFLLAGQWWFLVHLLRQNGRLLVRLEAVEGSLGTGGSVAPSQNGTHVQQREGLPVGSAAPEFGLSGLHGETLTLEALRSSGKPVMALFTDPGCGPCNAMLPEVGRWQQEHAHKLTLALVSRGAVEENRSKAQEHGLTNVLLQKDWEVSEAFEVRGTPSAVLIAPDGQVASPVAGGDEGIRGLLSYAVGERAQLPMQPRQPQTQGQPCPNCGKVHAAPTVEAAQKVGEEAPQVKLPDLEGNTVELADFRGKKTLVLFWNPGCGFCQQMLPDIKQWEENRPEGAPTLLFVSAGSEEANGDMKLSSKVMLDQQFAAGRAFGASGTPSAVLVDAEGRIASEVAVGAPAVLGLAGASRAES
jgi:peroxiredoxin/membrane associated rhomboid family serine protease